MRSPSHLQRRSQEWNKWKMQERTAWKGKRKWNVTVNTGREVNFFRGKNISIVIGV